jgi:hypothetical protein
MLGSGSANKFSGKRICKKSCWGTTEPYKQQDNLIILFYFLFFKKELRLKVDLKELSWGCMDWFHLAQDTDQWWALVNTIMNLGVP